MTSEADLIQRLLRGGSPVPTGVVGPGDDCAVLADGTLVTVDAMVEGVHWDDRASPEDVGWKLARVNLSDIAACGGRATGALLALSLPRADGAWVDAFARGLHAGLAGVPLLGGDTTGSPGPVVASLTTLGRVPGAPLLRSGASPGHRIWVGGTLCGAAAGFHHPEHPAWLGAWLRPAPPLELGPALVGVASAAMDLSDGLPADLARLCLASGVGALVHPTRLPLAAGLHALSDPLALLGWGEDYALLFTAPEAATDAVLAAGRRACTTVTAVGRVLPADRGVRLEGRPWPAAWSHFPDPPGAG